ncbi:MAG: glycoside hydrolase family 36 N-terminal domain-containing protein, partial [Pseudomonadota bacterium]
MISLETPKLWRLDSPDRSLVLLAQGTSVPRLLWFGQRMPADLDAQALASASAGALAHATVDEVAYASVFPVLADGHAGPPALRAHRDGRAFGHRPLCQSVTDFENGLVITLVDAVVALSIDICIALDEASGLCTWHTRLTNLGSDALTVDWVAAASLALPADFASCEHFSGRWGEELQRRRIAID